MVIRGLACRRRARMGPGCRECRPGAHPGCRECRPGVGGHPVARFQLAGLELR